MSLIPFAPFTQGYGQRSVKDCQADDFCARDVRAVMRAEKNSAQSGRGRLVSKGARRTVLKIATG